MHITRIKFISSFALCSLVAAIGAFAWAEEPDVILRIDKPVDNDLYVAHRDVIIRSQIDGDLVAAGQSITVDGNVTGDVIVAAQYIKIQSAVGDDLRAAGQHIAVDSTVAGHIVAAGQTVIVTQPVGEWAWLAGNTVEVLANVGGDLKIGAQEITINAEVDGNVELIGEKFRLGPDAIVRGELTWRSNYEAEISPDAQIKGKFIKQPLPDYLDESDDDGGLFFTISVIVATMALYLLFSRPLQASANQLAGHPGMSLLLGFAVFMGTPILAVLLLITGIGLWLGLAALGAWLLFLLLGVLTGLFAASYIVLCRFRPQPTMLQALAAIVVTVVAVGLLANVPVLGFVGVAAIWLLGIGALCWTSWVHLQSSERI
jgi:cytoskeletal protein CcmA (bactofilin family)